MYHTAGVSVDGTLQGGVIHTYISTFLLPQQGVCQIIFLSSTDEASLLGNIQQFGWHHFTFLFFYKRATV